MNRILFIALLFTVGCAKTDVTPIDNTPIPVIDTGTLPTDMLAAVNALRTKGCNCGTQAMPAVPALKWNTLLESASIRHAKNMAAMKSLTHTGSDGSNVQKRADDAGYRWSYISENIASGYLTLSAVMTAWKNSEGHCKNMMSTSVIEMGGAQSGDYWVQDFGKP
jgi:uncharacterized protein YkwD